MSGSTFGIIGLGTMGRNLALNIEEHGFPVAVWNLEPEWTDAFLRDHPKAKFSGAKTLDALVAALERPRRIMMMVPAGDPVDQMIQQLSPLLEPDDIVIDGGNSLFEDTRRREALLRERGLNFVGCGVSGGEEGARYGPSIMPGGSDQAWGRIRDVFEAIAAKTAAGPCVTHVGPDGAGHFVKMVHNGIEYGDMQIIAEAYDVLGRGLGLTTPEAADVFDEWNRGPLESFLVELTAHVCRVIDTETSQPLVDVIQDKAGQKGTGKWTAQVALELAVAIPTIGAALDARVLSSLKEQRVAASRILLPTHTSAPFAGSDRDEWKDALRDAVFAARVCSYAQGMALIAAGSSRYAWHRLAEMAPSGREAASSARGSSIRSVRRSRRTPRWSTCSPIPRSRVTCRPRLPAGAASPPRRRSGESRCPRWPRASRTSTAIAPRGFRRTSRRRSATPSARTSSNGWRSRGSCTLIGA
jgi:6-phosphogluconate dehydrogenase